MGLFTSLLSNGGYSLGMWDYIAYVALLIVGFYLLSKGADWFVDGAAGIATKLKIPQLVIGLTIVAMGTSAPEAAVSISSAIQGDASIAVGNIVGSNILNILIILGISATITSLAVDHSTFIIDIPVMLGATVLLTIFGIDEVVSWWESLIILVIFIAYIVFLVIKAMRERNAAEAEGNAMLTAPEEEKPTMPIWKALLFTLIGLIAIVAGSQCAVESATWIASEMGISDELIGLTVVALGTSLPELFTSVKAAMKNNADIAIGNIVGSNIFNILFILGIAGLITPIPFAPAFMIDAAVALGAAVLLLTASLKGKRLTRLGGIVMLLSYAAYFIYLLIAKGIIVI